VTILIAAQQPDHVVVGADSLTFGSENGEALAVTKSKLVKHGAVPLVLASTGFAGIIRERLFITDVVAGVLEETDDAKVLDLNELIPRLCERLIPIIRRAQAMPKAPDRLYT